MKNDDGSSELTEIDQVAWENVARKIFYECLASTSSSSSVFSFSPLSSTTSKVEVETLVDYIRNNDCAGNYRNTNFLDKLQKSIEDVSWNGQVNYASFKKASRHWIAEIQQRMQDGNNNMPKHDSRPDFEKRNSGDSSDTDRGFGILGEHCRKTKTPRKFVTADFVDLLNVSSYSPSSDTTHGCAMSDTTPESTDDIDSGCGISAGIGEISQADLRMRVRRFDEENAMLREDLVTAEELAAELQRQLNSLRLKLDQTKEKCRQLERENDKNQQLLHEADQKERDSRWSLQKLEKEKNILARKLEDAEAEKQQIAILNSKLERCKKEKYECIREATVCKRELEDKQKDCELLKEEVVQLIEANKNLQESYDESVKRLRDKIQDLKENKFDFRISDTGESPSDGISSTTPIGYFHSYTQNTPWSDNGLQDSLFDELKATSFSATNESRVRELESELSWYEKENHQAVNQIDKILELSCFKRSISNVPDPDRKKANDDADVSVLLRKISELSDMVKKIIQRPNAKEVSSQLCSDSTYTNKLLASQFGIRSFEDQLRFLREKAEREAAAYQDTSVLQRGRDTFIAAFSVNASSQIENVEEVEIAFGGGYLDKDNDSTDCKTSMPINKGLQEHTIIQPIVQELDRIIQCTNKPEEKLTVHSVALKNPRHRGISTAVHDSSATEFRWNSCEWPAGNLASTYVLSSGGDGISREMITDAATDTVDTSVPADPTHATVLVDDLRAFQADAPTEPMRKSRTFDNTKITEIDDTIPEESLESELLNTESNRMDDSFSTLSRTSERPATPRSIDESLWKKRKRLPNGGVTDYPRKSIPNTRSSPKRKISVFHRSFDIDTVDDETQSGEVGSNNYRLTERSSSTLSVRRTDESDDSRDFDPEEMKMSTNTRMFLSSYREKNENSDSSDNLSPTKPQGHWGPSSPPEATPSQQTSRRVILAPTKLKLPALVEMPLNVSVANNYAKRSDEATRVVNMKTHLDGRKNRDVDDETGARVKETRQIHEKINLKKDKFYKSCKPSNCGTELEYARHDIESGITYRKTNISRELDFSDYSLLLRMDSTGNTGNDVSQETSGIFARIVSSSNSEREITSKLPLSTTYDKPQVGDRACTHQDPSNSRGLSYGRVGEADRRYQRGNENTTSAGNYEGVTGMDIRDGQVEKANASPAVALAMSSGEDSSDSECDPMSIRENDNVRRNVVNETRSISPTVLKFRDGALLGTSTPAPTNNNNNNYCNNNIKKLDEIRNNCDKRKSMARKRDKRERPHTIRRSLSEGGCGGSKCRCHFTNLHSSSEESNKEENCPVVFPSLTDVRLQESGIAKLPNNDELQEDLPEAELERKYIALSVGLVTDRMTLPSRVGLSIRQRDQSERNLACEVQKMQQDIQDLAPLCIDRESVERVERVRHQLEMINQCAHRVSCTAETLGAVHQENRVSRAILLADRYLFVLRSRCEKLAHDLSETKRILTENNIVIEEHNGELGDDMPRTRYRGVPITNRTMIARRRASIATIFRPLGNFQDVTKDGLKQRNSVSGRVTLRRPSLTAECQKWEAEKLDRTDSSGSTGELREIFEQAESRRSSREEQNNVLRLHSSNLSTRERENSNEIEVWTNAEEPVLEVPAIEDQYCDSKHRRTSLPHWVTADHVPWKTMLWCIIVSFFFGFYIKHVVSSFDGCSGTHYKWWSIEEILRRYLPVEDHSRTPL